MTAVAVPGLHDIVEPAAIGWWPLAPGWWWVAALVALVGMRVAQWQWQRWRRQAYRRRAMAAWVRLTDTGVSPATRVIGCLQLLRDCCQAIGSDTLAATRGEAWIAVLAAWGRCELADVRLRTLLGEAAYCPPGSLTADDAQRMMDFTGRWLRSHRPAPAAA